MSNTPPITYTDKFLIKDVVDQDGTVLTTRQFLQVTGTGVQVTDDPTNNRTVLEFTAGSSAGQAPAPVVNGLNSNVSTNDNPTLRLTGPTAAFSLGGFALLADATPAAGQTLDVINTTAQLMTVVHEDAGSTPAYRLACPGGVAVSSYAPGQTARFVYSGSTSRWALQTVGATRATVFHVQDFGAVGDGATDDHDALARTAAAAAQVGGTVYLPGLPFAVGSTWAIPSNVTIRAEAGAVIQALAAATMNYVVTLTSVSNVALLGLTVDVNKAARLSQDVPLAGLQVVSSTDVRLEGVTVKNASGTATGGSVSFELDGTRITAVGCLAINAGAFGSPIYYCDGFYCAGDEIVLSACIADSCADTGFIFENCSRSTGSNLVAKNCGDGFAITAFGASGEVYTDNSFSNIVIQSLQASSSGCVVGLSGSVANGNTNAFLTNTRINGITIDIPNFGGAALSFLPANDAGYVGRVSNTWISDIVVVTGGAQSVLVSCADDTTITGGNLTGQVPVQVQADCTGTVLDNLRIAATSTFAIQVGSGCNDTLVRDCIATGAMSYGVYFFGTSTGITCVDNLFVGGSLLTPLGIGSDSGTVPQVSSVLAPNMLTLAGAPDGVLSASMTGAGKTGLGFGSAGALGGIGTQGDGETRVAGSLLVDIGLSSGAYPWTFDIGARVRNNSLGRAALGVGGTDTSASPALLQVGATGNTNWQLLLLPGGATPSAALDGAMCYDGTNLSWSHDLGVTLAGTAAPTNGSATVPTTNDLTGVLSGGSIVDFASQPEVYYTVASVTSAHVVLTAVYAGTTSASTAISTVVLETEDLKATGPNVNSTITPGSMLTLGYYSSGDIAVTNMRAGDLVKVTPPAALEAGLVWCWVPGSTAGTVNVRIFNASAGTVSAVGRQWSFAVEH